MAGSDISKRITIYINGKEVENSVKAIRAEYVHLNNSINKTTIGTEEYERKVAELQKAKAILDEHNTKIRGIGSAWDKSKTSAGGAWAVMKGVLGAEIGASLGRGIVDAGKKLFDLGSQMEQLNANAKTVFGESLPLVTAEAEKNASAIGLTVNQYQNAAANIGDLLVPMGFQREEAANISSQLVNLSGAMSEWVGGQQSAKEITDILAKAMLGEREQLKTLGVSIQEADIQNRLLEKGMEKLTGTSLQQAKAMITLDLIMEKSQDTITTFAQNSGSSLRMQAQTAANVQNAWEQLALALAPAINRLSEGMLKMSSGIGKISDGLSSLIAPAKTAGAEFASQQIKVQDLEKNFVPLIDRYEELKSKSELTTEEQVELDKIIQQIAKTTPSAITQIDQYGKVLDISAEASRAFVQREKDRLQFVNKEAINAYQKEIEYLEEQEKKYAAILNLKNRTQGSDKISAKNLETIAEVGGRAANKLEKIRADLNGARAELDRISGNPFEVPVDTSSVDNATEKINYLKLSIEQLKALSGAGDEQALKELSNREKAADKLKKQSEREQKDRESRHKKLLEFIAKAGIEQDLVKKDEDEQEIERIRLKYKEQIDLTIELEKRGYKDSADNRAALERLREAEIDQYNEARIKKLSEAATKLADQMGLKSLSAFSKEQQEIRAKFTELIADAEKMASEGSAKSQVILDDLNKAQSTALKTLSDKYFTQIIADKDKLLDASKKSASNIIGFELATIKTLYQKQIDEILAHEQENHNLTEAQLTLLHEARVQLAIQREEDLGNAKHGVSKKFFDLLKEVEGETLAETLTLMDMLYNELITSTEANQIDLTDITRRYVQLRSDIVKKGNDDDLKNQNEAKAKEVKLWQDRAAFFGDMGDVFSSINEIIADESIESLKLKRGLTLAQIAFDTGAAISSAMAMSTANPANPFTFGGAGIAQFAAVLSAILAGMAKASAVINTPIPQRFMGGYFGDEDKKKSMGQQIGDYFSVIGAEDSKKYEAQYIGAQSTGMLPDKPSLVLASEKGAEYFVSNEDLQKPAVANYVRMIENIRTNRVPQKADGGFSNPSAVSVPATDEMGTRELINMIARNTMFLEQLLSTGVRATTILDDDTIVRTNQRFSEINTISGGVLKS